MKLMIVVFCSLCRLFFEPVLPIILCIVKPCILTYILVLWVVVYELISIYLKKLIQQTSTNQYNKIRS